MRNDPHRGRRGRGGGEGARGGGGRGTGSGQREPSCSCQQARARGAPEPASLPPAPRQPRAPHEPAAAPRLRGETKSAPLGRSLVRRPRASGSSPAPPPAAPSACPHPLPPQPPRAGPIPPASGSHPVPPDSSFPPSPGLSRAHARLGTDQVGGGGCAGETPGESVGEGGETGKLQLNPQLGFCRNVRPI